MACATALDTFACSKAAQKQEAHHPLFHEDNVLPVCIGMKTRLPNFSEAKAPEKLFYFRLSATATATATVAPTMGCCPFNAAKLNHL